MKTVNEGYTLRDIKGGQKMKKRRLLMVAIVCFVLIMGVMTSQVFAVGTSSCDSGNLLGSYAEGRYVHTCTWTGDSATGDVPDATVYLSGYLVKVVTDPGDTAPTDNYDIAINGPYGSDVMGGALANRDTVNTETAFAFAQDGTTVIFPMVHGLHTVSIPAASQNVNSATGSIYIYVQK